MHVDHQPVPAIGAGGSSTKLLWGVRTRTTPAILMRSSCDSCESDSLLFGGAGLLRFEPSPAERGPDLDRDQLLALAAPARGEVALSESLSLLEDKPLTSLPAILMHGRWQVSAPFARAKTAGQSSTGVDNQGPSRVRRGLCKKAIDDTCA